MRNDETIQVLIHCSGNIVEKEESKKRWDGIKKGIKNNVMTKKKEN